MHESVLDSRILDGRNSGFSTIIAQDLNGAPHSLLRSAKLIALTSLIRVRIKKCGPELGMALIIFDCQPQGTRPTLLCVSVILNLLLLNDYCCKGFNDRCLGFVALGGLDVAWAGRALFFRPACA